MSSSGSGRGGESAGSAEIRARLGHPVIDGDGHTLEVVPAVAPYVASIGGKRAQLAFEAILKQIEVRPDLAQRRASARPHPGFWLNSARSELDRATCHLPALLDERLGELGFDFMVVYPSMGLFTNYIGDTELRQVWCRALNTFHADVFREHSRTLTPAMAIPLHDPEEGIRELEYVVNVLGMKVALIPGHIERPLAGQAPGATWLDQLAIDSLHDYDRFWKKAVELRVALASHQDGDSRYISPSNFVHGHLGLFATSHHALARSLFLGGVTRRFPELRLAFLEGGVGWALSLYADLCEHWEKRNVEALTKFNPERLNPDVMAAIFARYGRGPLALPPDVVKGFKHFGDLPPDAEVGLDDFAACGVKSEEDIHELFVPRFSFGCEAGDRLVPVALSERSPVGARLSAFFGSDVAHWDSPDIARILVEAHELVERGFLSAEQFRAFTFENAVRFYAGMNRDFFEGTSVEHEARAVLLKR